MVTVTLGVPRRAGRDWICPYSISGLAVPERLKAYGSDELQALSNALGLIDRLLHESGRRLAWFPDDDPWDRLRQARSAPAALPRAQGTARSLRSSARPPGSPGDWRPAG
jgi:hypothetical protein